MPRGEAYYYLDDLLDTVDKVIEEAAKEATKKGKEVIHDAYKRGLTKGAKDVGGPFDIPPDPFALDFLDGYLADLMEGFGRDLGKGIKLTIRDAIANGWSMPRTAAELSRRLKLMEHRARTIARTEVQRAANMGRYHAWEKSGKVEGKEWLTYFDDRTCPICAGLDGERRKLSEPFSIGVMMPPAHPNCRCTAVPILKKGEFAAKKPSSRDLVVKREEKALGKIILSEFGDAVKRIKKAWSVYYRSHGEGY